MVESNFSSRIYLQCSKKKKKEFNPEEIQLPGFTCLSTIIMINFKNHEFSYSMAILKLLEIVKIVVLQM